MVDKRFDPDDLIQKVSELYSYNCNEYGWITAR
jgi:hypothetical protein